jgi:hypothetical protein
MGGRLYPLPMRPHWHTLIEFRDGQHIVGADDELAVDAWRRIHWLAPQSGDPAADRVAWKQRIIDHARVIYECPLDGINGDTPDSEWLDALSASGALTVIRK